MRYCCRHPQTSGVGQNHVTASGDMSRSVGHLRTERRHLEARATCVADSQGRPRCRRLNSAAAPASRRSSAYVIAGVGSVGRRKGLISTGRRHCCLRTPIGCSYAEFEAVRVDIAVAIRDRRAFASIIKSVGQVSGGDSVTARVQALRYTFRRDTCQVWSRSERPCCRYVVRTSVGRKFEKI